MKTLHPKILNLKKNVAGTYVYQQFETELDYRVVTNSEGNESEGYLAVFGIPDEYKTVAVRGCFAKSIKERGPNSTAKNKIGYLWFHKLDEPIGQFTELVEDDYGLRFKAVHDKGVAISDRARIQIASGTLNQFSYGFKYVWDKMEFDEENEVVLMYECDLYEGSVCGINSANSETYAIRSLEQFAKEVEELGELAESFINGLANRSQQFELRQLITRYKTLTTIKPDALQTLKEDLKPSNKLVKIGGYNLDVKQFI